MRSNKLFILIITALAGALISLPLQAQSRILPIMESTTSVRSMGMGHTTLGVDREMHLYSNPAALLFLEDTKSSIGVSSEIFPKSDVGRLMQYNMSAGYKFADEHAAFLGFRYQGGLSIPTFAEGSLSASDMLKPREWTVDLGYAFSVTPNIAVYAQGTYFSTKYASAAQGVAFGAGMAYNRAFETGATTGILTLGARLQDLGPAVKFDGKGLAEALPTSVSLGGDYRQELVEGHFLTLAVTGRYFTPRHAELLLMGAGLEYSYQDWVAVRVGYRGGQRELAHWTVGLGGSYAGFQLNAAYMMSLRPETSPSVLVFSLGYQF